MVLVGKGGILEEMCSMPGGPCRSRQHMAAMALAGSSGNSDVVNRREGCHYATRVP